MQDDGTDQLRARVASVWHEIWSTVRPASGPITAAMPFHTISVEVKEGSSPDSFMAGRQHVIWLGVDRERGLVHSARAWDPSDQSSPPVPDMGWTICDQDFFRKMISPTGLGFTRDFPHQVLGHYHRVLPLPYGPFDEISEVDVHDVVRKLHDPVARCVDALGIQQKTLRVFGLRSINGVGIPYRTSSFAPLIWLAGTTKSPGVDLALVRERRLQALHAMPLFAHGIIRSIKTTSCIDEARELLPCVAAQHGVQPGTVKVLNEAASQVDQSTLIAMRRTVDYAPSLEWLDALPSSTLRECVRRMDSNDWNSLYNRSMAISESTPPGVFTQMARRQRMPEAGLPDWLEDFNSQWSHLPDVAGDFARDLLWPIGAALHGKVVLDREDARDLQGVATIMLASLGPDKLHRVILAHLDGELRRAAEIVTDQNGGEGWAVPAEPIVAPTGQVIRFLATPAELAHEGLKMSHCVSSYADACLERRCSIMSMGTWQGDEWQPSSTVELRATASGIQVQQHQGVNNSRPPADDVAALETWMGGLLTGETVFDNTHLRAVGPQASIEQVHGGEWNTAEAAAARWDSWRRLLNVRQRDVGAFLRHAVDVMLTPDQADWPEARFNLRQRVAEAAQYEQQLGSSIDTVARIRESEALLLPGLR